VAVMKAEFEASLNHLSIRSLTVAGAAQVRKMAV
jgi:hypothetical protein